MANFRYAIVNNNKMSIPDIKNGDVFELFEPCGELVGKFTATSDGYIEDGIGTIDCEKVE